MHSTIVATNPLSLSKLMLFNILILFASACLKTIPADDVRFRALSSKTLTSSEAQAVPSVPDSELTSLQSADSAPTSDAAKSARSPIRVTPTLRSSPPAPQASSSASSQEAAPSESITAQQDDYSAHLTQFRSAAKTFKSSSSSSSSSSTEKPLEVEKSTSHEVWTQKAKTFASKIDSRSGTEDEKSKEEIGKDTDNEVSDSDLYKALKLQPTDICSSCPKLWMDNTSEMNELCSNYESVANFFSMTMDKGNAESVEDKNDLKECVRTIKCQHPHMLVKWFDSDLCDVHSPTTGTLISDPTNSFVYKCNGTHWSMLGFPITSIICARNTN